MRLHRRRRPPPPQRNSYTCNNAVNCVNAVGAYYGTHALGHTMAAHAHAQLLFGELRLRSHHRRRRSQPLYSSIRTLAVGSSHRICRTHTCRTQCICQTQCMLRLKTRRLRVWLRRVGGNLWVVAILFRLSASEVRRRRRRHLCRRQRLSRHRRLRRRRPHPCRRRRPPRRRCHRRRPSASTPAARRATEFARTGAGAPLGQCVSLGPTAPTVDRGSFSTRLPPLQCSLRRRRQSPCRQRHQPR